LGFENAQVIQDQEFYFFGLTSKDLPNAGAMRLRLDCDGDYLTSIELKWGNDRTQNASVDGLQPITLTWYAAADQASVGQASSGQVSGVHTLELAVAKEDLPGPVHRFRVHSGSAEGDSSWQALPVVERWFPPHP
jgi:hypothetical protein